METTEEVVSTPELTEHEQEMINLVQDREQQARASADPSLAEPSTEESDTPEEQQQEDTVDYKAKYEELQKQLDEKQINKLDIEQEKEVKETEDVKEASDVLTPNEMSKFTEEFNANGSLSEESYKELSNLGLSKEVVDTYIEGQTALQEVKVNRVFNEVGGSESYNEMVNWAKDNWDQQQIEVFNRNVNSGDDALVMFSVKALKEQYTKTQGSPIPNRALKGSAQGESNGSLKGYENKQEMFKAMRNPAYGKDPSYTKMVENKIKNSKF